MRKIKVNEYEVIEDLKNGVFKVLRHGEEWQDLTGNNFVLSLIDLIDNLNKENEAFQKDSEFLNCLICCGVDNWNGWEEAVEMMAEE